MFLKTFTKLLSLAAILAVFSCQTPKQKDIPYWYINQKNNDSLNLYGIGEGFNLFEAKSSALSDLAGKISVTISSDSTLISEENKISVNEELRKRVSQNIAKINFSDVKVTNSANVGNRFYIEIAVDRENFVQNQQENIEHLNKQIAGLEQNSQNQHIIHIRNNLAKIIDLSNQIEASGRILQSLGENVNLQKTLDNRLRFEGQLKIANEKLAFLVDAKEAKPELGNLFKNQINKNGFRITSYLDDKTLGIKLMQKVRYNKIYEAYLAKLTVNIEVIANGKLIASNQIETTGSSTMNEREAYFSALERIREIIEEQGILQILKIN